MKAKNTMVEEYETVIVHHHCTFPFNVIRNREDKNPILIHVILLSLQLDIAAETTHFAPKFVIAWDSRSK